jgi:RNA polymerase sigma-70 factor, ECF subfamily
MESASKDTTRVLQELSKDKDQILADAIPEVYSELRRLAACYLRRERIGHTLQATALVHEAYLRLAQQKTVQWLDRSEFLGVAAQLMRRILVDYSRARHAAKRGGKTGRVFLEETAIISKDYSADVIAVDEVLTRLASLDAQQARIVELRFFSGLSIEETGRVLDISPATVKREWNVAKAWLTRELRSTRNTHD